MYLFIIKHKIYIFLFKESACSAGDWGLILGLGRSPGEGNTNPHHYSCLEHPTKRAWQATVHGVTKSQTQLSNFTLTSSLQHNYGSFIHSISFGCGVCPYAHCWRRKWQPTPVFLSEKSYGQRNLVGYSSWDR